MKNEQVEKMVERFLCWELPDDFYPDGGISYNKIGNHKPVGTNLLTATQAREMIEYMLAGEKENE